MGEGGVKHHILTMAGIPPCMIGCKGRGGEMMGGGGKVLHCGHGRHTSLHGCWGCKERGGDGGGEG